MDIGATFWAVKRGYGLPFREIAPEDRLPVARVCFISKLYLQLSWLRISGKLMR